MRATAKVHIFPLCIDGQAAFIIRMLLNQLQFIRVVLEDFQGFFLCHLTALRWEVFLDNLSHLLFNLGQIFIGNLTSRIICVVVKTILNRRTNPQFNIWEMAFGGLGKEVGSRMAKDVKRILVVRGHDFKGTIFCDGPRSVNQLTVELTSKGFFSQ